MDGLVLEVLHYHVPEGLGLLHDWIVLAEPLRPLLLVSLRKGDSVLQSQSEYLDAGLDDLLESAVAADLVDLSVADPIFDIVRLE